MYGADFVNLNIIIVFVDVHFIAWCIICSRSLHLIGNGLHLGLSQVKYQQ